MFVFDATPLIYLAKASQISLLSNRSENRVIPRLVYEEVVTTGIEAGYPDARRIEQEVDENHFTVEEAPPNALFDRISSNARMSAADAAVLALADEKSGIAVMDEAYGRRVAETESVETHGTAYLLLALVADGAIDAKDAIEAFDDIVEAGWYCSTNLYAKVMQTLDTYGDK